MSDAVVDAIGYTSGIDNTTNASGEANMTTSSAAGNEEPPTSAAPSHLFDEQIMLPILKDCRELQSQDLCPHQATIQLDHISLPEQARDKVMISLFLLAFQCISLWFADVIIDPAGEIGLLTHWNLGRALFQNIWIPTLLCHSCPASYPRHDRS